MTEIPDTMKGAVLPGDSTAQIKEFDVPEPGQGEVLIRMKASTICGSDIRCIYHEHAGKGPEGYQTGTIAGHEPCGRIVKEGNELRRFREGDRVVVYHISGCGICEDCRQGYMVSCTSEWRCAYGWQRNGGMAEYMLAEEKDLVHLPDELSYSDGAQIACGFGTVYEGLEKVGINGSSRVLVTGLGPVGLAAGMLARALGATYVIGIDAVQERMRLAEQMGLFDDVFEAGSDNVNQVTSVTEDKGVERAIDCSGNEDARKVCIKATRAGGKVCLVGEGGRCSFEPSEDIIHAQKTICGSWVTSIWKMQELAERIVRWGIHPADLITHRVPLTDVDKGYQLAASGTYGKIAVVFDEEAENI